MPDRAGNGGDLGRIAGPAPGLHAKTVALTLPWRVKSPCPQIIRSCAGQPHANTRTRNLPTPTAALKRKERRRFISDSFPEIAPSSGENICPGFLRPVAHFPQGVARRRASCIHRRCHARARLHTLSRTRRVPPSLMSAHTIALASTPSTPPAACRLKFGGLRQPRYHVFGPALRSAEAHEQAGLPGTVHADFTFAAALRATPALPPPTLQDAFAAPSGWRAAPSGKDCGGNGCNCCGDDNKGIGVGEASRRFPRAGAAKPASLDGGPFAEAGGFGWPGSGSVVLTPWVVDSEDGGVIYRSGEGAAV